MAVKVWFAKEAEVTIDLASNVTITSSGLLDSFFSSGSAVSKLMKDISVTVPMTDVEKIDLMGSDSNDFQNAEFEEKPANMAELSGTLLLTGNEEINAFLFDAGSAVPGSPTHTRYRAGKGTIRKLAMLLNLDDDTDEVSYVFDNAVATAHEVRATGADGHMEITVTLKSLPRDFYGPEFKN